MSAAAARSVDVLTRGCVFRQFEGDEIVFNRFIWCELSEGTLYWDKEGSRHRSNDRRSIITDLAFLSTEVDGYPIFEENVHAAIAPENEILALEFHPPSQTLFLQAPNSTVRDQWAQAIQMWKTGGLQGYYDATTPTPQAATHDKYNNNSEQHASATPSPGAPMKPASAYNNSYYQGSIEEEEDDDDDGEDNDRHAQLLSVAPSNDRNPPPPSSTVKPVGLSSPPPSNNTSQLHQPQRPSAASASAVPPPSQRTHAPAPAPAVTHPAAARSPLEDMFGHPPQQDRQPAYLQQEEQQYQQQYQSDEAYHNDQYYDQQSYSADPSHPPSSDVISRTKVRIVKNPYTPYWSRNIPPEYRAEAREASINLGLHSILTGVHHRLRQKAEDFGMITELTQALEEQYYEMEQLEKKYEMEYGALAMASDSSHEQGGNGGKIEIRIGTMNLEHEVPHQYVAILYLKHPLGEEYEYSQTCSLQRSNDGRTYMPKFLLGPTELFAVRLDDVDQVGDHHHQQQQLVGAQLRVELWDIVNTRLYGENWAHDLRRSKEEENGGHDSGELETSGYQGEIDVDMNELVRAKHHVLSFPLENRNRRGGGQRGIQFVLQYCRPYEEEQTYGGVSSSSSSGGVGGVANDPLMTLRLKQLEEELLRLRGTETDISSSQTQLRDMTLKLHEERKIRNELEQRLVQEQLIRVKHEQEVMRLKPRALELADTSDELGQARKKVKELEFTIKTLQVEIRKATLPPNPHAMLDELLSIDRPSLVDLLRIKKFILEQERIRCMLVEEMSASRKTYVAYETTHDELVRRENALNTHIHWLEDEKHKLTVQNAELTTSLQQLQLETVRLSNRCSDSEQSKELMEVNLTYLIEQQRLQKKKIEELERSLLVHHSQMKGFEYAHLPVPQQVERQYKMDKQADEELDAQLAKAQWLLDNPQPDEPEESPAAVAAAAASAGDPSASPSPDGDGVGIDGVSSQLHPDGSAPLLRHPDGRPLSAEELIAAASVAKSKPRKTKIVYSDALEQSLAAAGINWTAK